jgi:hypothetical protein
MKRHILIFLRFGIAFLLIADLIGALFIQYYEIDPYHPGTHNQYPDYQGPITTQIIWPFLKTIGCFVLDNPELITAIATAFIAAYTIILARATKALTSLARQQERTSRTHERAYMIGGGPARLPSDGVITTDLGVMTIENWGKTPGFVTKVQWGICSTKDFPNNTSVSKAIDDNLLPEGTVQNVPFAEQVYPPSSVALPYRMVSFDLTNSLAKIFFGRIIYRDVFKDLHHSTFKLIVTNNVSVPLEGSYSEDWS